MQTGKKTRETLRERRSKKNFSVLSYLDDSETLRRRGESRVLIVVPMHTYDAHEFGELNRVLEERGIHSVIASSTGGVPRSNKGRSMQRFAELQLEAFDPDYFDVVFFVGGTVSEFKRELRFQKIEHMLASAMQNGLCIAATSDSAKELLDISGWSVWLKNVFKDSVRYGRAKDAAGAVLAVKHTSQIATMVEKAMALRAANFKHQP